MWSELFDLGNRPTDEQAAILVKSVGDRCRDAAKALKEADVLLVVTGAGFSADSGLAVYNDVARVPAYQQRDLDYSDICVPDFLFDEPSLFYGFWGQCFNDYRLTEPHHGYHILARWKDDKNANGPVATEIKSRIARKVELRRPFDDEVVQRNSPYKTKEGEYAAAFFSFTSNVDAHWYDILEAHEIHECHGNIETWQCSDYYCPAGIWRAPLKHHFEVNQTTMLAPESRAMGIPAVAPSRESHGTFDNVAHIGQTRGLGARTNTLANMPEGRTGGDWSEEVIGTLPGDPVRVSNYPKCGRCREPARPAILMFGDFGWKRDIAQGERWDLWKESVMDLCERRRRDQSDPLKICIVEIGCGLNVPTCRGVSERMVLEGQNHGGEVKLVRVNPDYPVTADDDVKDCLIPIMARGLESILKIDSFYRAMT